MAQMTFTKACKDYFGYKAGQNLGGFMEEIKALDEADRAYFKREFAKVDIEIIG